MGYEIIVWKDIDHTFPLQIQAIYTVCIWSGYRAECVLWNTMLQHGFTHSKKDWDDAWMNDPAEIFFGTSAMLFTQELWTVQIKDRQHCLWLLHTKKKGKKRRSFPFLFVGILSDKCYLRLKPECVIFKCCAVSSSEQIFKWTFCFVAFSVYMYL